MNQEKTRDTVIERLCALTGRNDITPEMSFESDIQLTSVNIMKLSFDLENALDIDQIPQEKFYDIETVQDLIDVVAELV